MFRKRRDNALLFFMMRVIYRIIIRKNMENINKNLTFFIFFNIISVTEKRNLIMLKEITSILAELNDLQEEQKSLLQEKEDYRQRYVGSTAIFDLIVELQSFFLSYIGQNTQRRYMKSMIIDSYDQFLSKIKYLEELESETIRRHSGLVLTSNEEDNYYDLFFVTSKSYKEKFLKALDVIQPFILANSYDENSIQRCIFYLRESSRLELKKLGELSVAISSYEKEYAKILLDIKKNDQKLDLVNVKMKSFMEKEHDHIWYLKGVYPIANQEMAELECAICGQTLLYPKDNIPTYYFTFQKNPQMKSLLGARKKQKEKELEKIKQKMLKKAQ